MTSSLPFLQSILWSSKCFLAKSQNTRPPTGCRSIYARSSSKPNFSKPRYTAQSLACLIGTSPDADQCGHMLCSCALLYAMVLVSSVSNLRSPCWRDKIVDDVLMSCVLSRNGLPCGSLPAAMTHRSGVGACVAAAAAHATATTAATTSPAPSTAASTEAGHLGQARIDLLLRLLKDIYEIASLLSIFDLFSKALGGSGAWDSLSVVKRVMAVPLAPARPVRPIRWT